MQCLYIRQSALADHPVSQIIDKFICLINGLVEDHPKISTHTFYFALEDQNTKRFEHFAFGKE